jgi:hypothetical protein
MVEDQPSGRKTILDQRLMAEMRTVLVKGVEYLVQILHDKIKSDPVLYNFDDIELALNTEPLYADRCPVLDVNELAHFVRLTELPSKPEVKARALTIGVVLVYSRYLDAPEGAVSPFNARIWETARASWVNTDDASVVTDPKLIPEIQKALLDAMYTSCIEYAQSNFSSSPMKIE